MNYCHCTDTTDISMDGMLLGCSVLFVTTVQGFETSLIWYAKEFPFSNIHRFSSGTHNTSLFNVSGEWCCSCIIDSYRGNLNGNNVINSPYTQRKYSA